MPKRTWSVLALAAALVASASSAQAAYPDKPIQFIVGSAAGGSTDLLARAVAQVAPRFFPQSLVVVNKAGGGGIPARVDLLRSPPDGYNLLVGYGGGEDTIAPHQRQVPYDIVKDFEPVCRLSIHSVVMVVAADSPYKTLADLVADGKGKPKGLTAAVSLKGAAVDITLQLFGHKAGIKVISVPGSGGSDAITRVIGGHADIGAGHPSEVLPHIKAGRLRPLAVALEQRDASVPDLPTFRELGYDVVTAGSVKGLAVKKGTPKEIVAYLDGKCRDIAKDSEFNSIMKTIAQPVNYMSGPEYTPWFKQATDTYAALLKSLAIDTK
jgi:tripartite-type tricarboxylate transporter receptor subunit TctC